MPPTRIQAVTQHYVNVSTIGDVTPHVDIPFIATPGNLVMLAYITNGVAGSIDIIDPIIDDGLNAWSQFGTGSRSTSQSEYNFQLAILRVTNPTTSIRVTMGSALGGGNIKPDIWIIVAEYSDFSPNNIDIVVDEFQPVVTHQELTQAGNHGVVGFFFAGTNNPSGGPVPPGPDIGAFLGPITGGVEVVKVGTGVGTVPILAMVEDFSSVGTISESIGVGTPTFGMMGFFSAETVPVPPPAPSPRGLGCDLSRNRNAFLLLEKLPKSGQIYEMKAINYDDAYYANDDMFDITGTGTAHVGVGVGTPGSIGFGEAFGIFGG